MKSSTGIGLAACVAAGALVLTMEGCGGGAPEGTKAPSASSTPAAPAAGTLAALSEQDFARGKEIYFDTCAGCHGSLRKVQRVPTSSPCAPGSSDRAPSSPS